MRVCVWLGLELEGGDKGIVDIYRWIIIDDKMIWGFNVRVQFPGQGLIFKIKICIKIAIMWTEDQEEDRENTPGNSFPYITLKI